MGFGEFGGGEGIEFVGGHDGEVGLVIGHGNKYYFIYSILSYTIRSFLVIPVLCWYDVIRIHSLMPANFNNFLKALPSLSQIQIYHLTQILFSFQ